ncbi:MAG: GyrI-like domain-containing protein [Erysipelotrichaceae bacterium]|nr:GyrI-like domain-containing protein [Erysipelotrichaceae bacterium]
MKYELIDLPKIAVIGKAGLCTKEKNIVQDLWQQANSDFHEVAPLGMKNPDGSFVGFWGAMSDETMSFLPWTNDFSTGLYLAGIEVYEDTETPEGWTKWIMPARKYLVVEVAPKHYGEIFGCVIGGLLPELGMKLTGAVCDFTEPTTGQNKLFFPVEYIGQNE